MNEEITNLTVNNRKKAFEMTIRGKNYHFPFSKLTLIPSADDAIVRAYVDRECGDTAFTYHLASGKEDTIVADAVLEYNRDPEYVRDVELCRLSVEAQKRIKALGVSRSEICRRMGVQMTQLLRLIDQTFYGKTIDQMMRLFAALDCVIEFKIKPVKSGAKKAKMAA